MLITGERRPFTVTEYDQIQREPYNQPLWARRVPAVESLLMEPSDPGRWSVRIIDQGAYDDQMRRLLGLGE